MNANKQLINLAGIVVVVVLLVAGLALVAMPLYTQSQSIDAQASTVGQSNMLYEQQIAALTEAETRIDQIDADVADLRREIAAFPKLDDVHRLISAAAKKVDVRIQTVEATNETAWQPRGAPSVDGADGSAAATETAAAAPAATEGETPAVPTGETPAPAEAPVDEASPNRQVLLTITIDTALPYDVVTADDEENTSDGGETADDEASSDESAEERARRLEALARKAVDFIDALRSGPRLITPVDLKYEDGTAVITVLTYFRTEAS